MADSAPIRAEHVACAALDDSGCAYLVFDPVDPAADLEVRAINLGPERTFVHAEQLALDFNEGRTLAFEIEPGEMRVGDQIPRLHRGLE